MIYRKEKYIYIKKVKLNVWKLYIFKFFCRFEKILNKKLKEKRKFIDLDWVKEKEKIGGKCIVEWGN